jgi:hypothetical protein
MLRGNTVKPSAFSNKVWAILIILLFSLPLLAACEKQEIIQTQGDYPYYTTGKDMTKFSDVIVVGKVKKDNQVQELNINSDKKAPPHFFIFTVSDFEVHEVLKGNIEPGKTIQIKQMGGELKGRKYVVEGETYLKQNNEYVLFLQYYRESEPLSLINPTQGSIQIMGEKILPAPDNTAYSNTLDKKSLISAIQADIASANAEPKVSVSPELRDKLLNK